MRTQFVTNRLFAIAAEMGQLKNEIQERRRVLNLFLINVKSKRSNKGRRTHWRCQREHKGKAEEGASAAGAVASTHCVGCHHQ
jgi:hypothetical protein